MPDREKVIRALTFCCYDIHTGDCSPDCPYYDACSDGSPIPAVMYDVLALLKEQEPKMVVQTTSTIRCPGCGKQITSKGAIHREINYCWKCGQAVKWND